MGHTCGTGYCSRGRRSGGEIPKFLGKGGAGVFPRNIKKKSIFEQDYCRFGGSTPGQLGQMLRKHIFGERSEPDFISNARAQTYSRFSILAPPAALLVGVRDKDRL